jgi:hypothetical protein
MLAFLSDWFFWLTLFNKTHTASDQGFIFQRHAIGVSYPVPAVLWFLSNRIVSNNTLRSKEERPCTLWESLEYADGLKSARAMLDRAVALAELIHPSGRAAG